MVKNEKQPRLSVFLVVKNHEMFMNSALVVHVCSSRHSPLASREPQVARPSAPSHGCAIAASCGGSSRRVRTRDAALVVVCFSRGLLSALHARASVARALETKVASTDARTCAAMHGRRDHDHDSSICGVVTKLI